MIATRGNELLHDRQDVAGTTRKRGFIIGGPSGVVAA